MGQYQFRFCPVSSSICLYWPGQREHTYIAEPRLRQRLSHVWGLIPLLSPEDQRHLLNKIADILVPGGKLLFTSCAGVDPLVWRDAMTGLASRSLGAAEYRRQLSAVGLSLMDEYEDEGQNHYYDVHR